MSGEGKCIASSPPSLDATGDGIMAIWAGGGDLVFSIQEPETKEQNKNRGLYK